jgi:hypothetical protein
MEQPGRPTRLARVRAAARGPTPNGEPTPAPIISQEFAVWLDRLAPNWLPSLEELRDPLAVARSIGRRGLVEEILAEFERQAGG